MITKILQKYDGFTNYWYPDVNEPTVYQSPDIEKYRKENEGEEKRLLNKYKKHIPPGWYGFSFGSPTPKAWFLIIEEFLDYLINLEKEGKIKNFEIHQYKLKFGGLRAYHSFECVDDELREFIDLQTAKLENHLYDEKLIY